MGDLTYEMDDKQWARALRAALPFAEFQKLVASKSVRVHVAEVDFELNQESRDTLRDMLKALTEPKAKS